MEVTEEDRVGASLGEIDTVRLGVALTLREREGEEEVVLEVVIETLGQPLELTLRLGLGVREEDTLAVDVGVPAVLGDLEGEGVPVELRELDLVMEEQDVVEGESEEVGETLTLGVVL